MRIVGLIAVAGLGLIGGSCADVTEPVSGTAEAASAAYAANAVNVLPDSHWETWQLGTFYLCDGSILQGGEYSVHLQSTFISRADGSAHVRYHINAARARGIASNGVEYVLMQAGNGAQWYTAAGPYTTKEMQSFRLISPGHASNLLLTYIVTLVSDGVNPPVVTMELVKNRCVG